MNKRVPHRFSRINRVAMNRLPLSFAFCAALGCGGVYAPPIIDDAGVAAPPEDASADAPDDVSRVFVLCEVPGGDPCDGGATRAPVR